MNDIESLKSWFGLISLIISVCASIYLFMTAGSKKTAGDLEEYKKTAEGEMKALMTAVTALGSRTQTLESELKHLPDAKAFMDMRLAISDLSAKLGRMEESQISTSRTVMQVQDFLMKSNAA